MSGYMLGALCLVAGVVVGLAVGWYLRGRYASKVDQMIQSAKADVQKVEKKVGL